MGIYRLPSDEALKNYGTLFNEDVHEWDPDHHDVRDLDPVWISRYKYEAEILSKIIKRNQFKKVLELGSGPGMLSQGVLALCPDVDYYLIDRSGAKIMFEERKYKGTFVVKDLYKEFDTTGLPNDFDFIVTNDFLEHISNPSLILKTCYSITKDTSNLFVSVPNWKMGHGFLYRGLFDYDNWIYFSMTHGWPIEEVYQSPLVCKHSPKLSSESCMDDSLITSWNWYFNSTKLLQQ